MKLKRYLWLTVLLATIAFSVLPAYSQQFFQPRRVFQVSTLGALNVGVYEGATTLAQLKQQGDFGLGTIEGLDGELVGLDGKFYHVKTDGIAYPVADEVKTPFATVAFFHTERSLRLNGQMNYQELQQQIDTGLPTQNLPYAIRIRGVFPYLKVRSVPKQLPPYLPLSDVISQQAAIFELRNVRGTLVGFRMPQYLESVNAAGYHFHLITSNRTSGGHLLDGEFLDSRVDIETLHDWQMMLPDNTAFKQAPLK